MKTLLTTLCLTSAVLLGSGAHGYDGPIFDAMAQIDEKSGFKKSVSRVRNSGVAKIALFARSRKLGEYETELIKLREDNKDLIILGAPKFFFHKSDIGQDFITRTLKNISKYNYAFVGEILYTHADKKHGRQHNSGEVYINPHGKGNLKFLEKVSKLIPLGRMAKKEELNGIIIYLLSDASSYVNGSIINIDGGRTAW